jgi:hypothetical protein
MRKSIYKWHKSFAETCCICDKNSGRQVSDETVEHVHVSFLHSPQKSTVHARREMCNASHMTVWRVLHKQLSFWPYKFQLLQELKPNDRPRPWDSRTDVLKHLKEDSLFLDKIVFSDKATFHLSGKVNHHNLIICGSQNPHQIHKHVRDSPKVNVFCAVSRTQVYGPFFPPRLPLWVACTVICWSTLLFHSWMWRVIW